MDSDNRTFKGTSISGGITSGTSRLMRPGAVDIDEIIIENSQVEDEIKKLDDAVELTVLDLTKLRESAGEKIGTAVAKIFDAQLMIATDSDFLGKIKDDIREKNRNAAFIYNSHTNNAVSPLKNSSDKYIRQMAIDIEAVASRVLNHLSGGINLTFKFPLNTILVGRYFTPGEILSFRQRKAVGFIVSEGGANSHMALIARSLMLPIVRVDNALAKFDNYQNMILDGSAGEVLIDPTDSEKEVYEARKKKLGASQLNKIKKLKSIPPLTSCGKIINIAGNLSLPGPAEEILSSQNIPVGLFRSEFLYLAYSDFPDEEQQLEHYQEISDKFSETKVTIRTFDVGYDKLVANSIWPTEDNPALGWRGIRPMLELTDIFKTQIRAILRASTRNNFKIMLPMISDITEYRSAVKLIDDVKSELSNKKIEFDRNIQIGIMVEVPSAALKAETLCKEVDFVSIGTNDLTQYTLAADRQNAKVASLYNSLHPAVLKLIEMTSKACRKNNIDISVCGELAGEKLAVPLLIGMKIDTLSMNPGKIVDSCRLISKISLDSAELLAREVLNCETVEEVNCKLEEYSKDLNRRKK